jgi:diaminohydroxyphosphoribosylaminopyrimidine deaminase / 5-amino-6-(5-phosphoribosylamino)uracil reductase
VIVASSDAPQEKLEQLIAAGCQILLVPAQCDAETSHCRADINLLLAELGRRQVTNVLVEGGSELLGSFFDARAVDEVHAFIAPKLIGGSGAPAPIGGTGVEKIAAGLALVDPQIRHSGDDLYIQGRIRTP